VSIEVYRDDWGIPHLRAGSAHELAFAQGRNAAADRAWQIEVERHRSQGTTAAFLGADALDWDRFARRARLDDTARRCFRRPHHPPRLPRPPGRPPGRPLPGLRARSGSRRRVLSRAARRLRHPHPDRPPPPTGPEPGFTGALLSAFLAWVLAADPARRRIVAEPDARNDKAMARFLRAGFVLGPLIDLPQKRARLVFLDRDAFAGG
jgi:hypothetical protein